MNVKKSNSKKKQKKNSLSKRSRIDADTFIIKQPLLQFQDLTLQLQSQVGHQQSPAYKNGDWLCMVCANLNFSFRNECNRCQNNSDQLKCWANNYYKYNLPNINFPYIRKSADSQLVLPLPQFYSITPVKGVPHPNGLQKNSDFPIVSQETQVNTFSTQPQTMSMESCKLRGSDEISVSEFNLDDAKPFDSQTKSTIEETKTQGRENKDFEINFTGFQNKLLLTPQKKQRSNSECTYQLKTYQSPELQNQIPINKLIELCKSKQNLDLRFFENIENPIDFSNFDLKSFKLELENSENNPQNQILEEQQTNDVTLEIQNSLKNLDLDKDFAELSQIKKKRKFTDQYLMEPLKEIQRKTSLQFRGNIE